MSTTIRSEKSLKEAEDRKIAESEVVGGYTMARCEKLMALLSVEKKVQFWVSLIKATGRIWFPLPGPQFRALHSEADELFYGGAAGGGKGSILTATVMTPHGPMQMGDMKVGQLISNPDGSVASIIGIQPLGMQDSYEVTFIDGAKTRVTEEHLWFYTRSSKRQKAERYYLDGDPIRGRIATTLMLRDMLEDQAKNRRNYWPLIPLTQPVPFTRSYKYDMRRLDPYVLGVLLGDGSLSITNRVSFSNVDDEIILEVKARTRPSDWGTSGISFYARGETRRFLITELERLGLMGKRAKTKFIPQAYKLADIETRRELLRGLMDTDGYADERGHCEYCSISKQLAEDVQWLVRSLGGKATSTLKPNYYRDQEGQRIDCQDAYVLYIQTPDNSNLFKLGRKKDRAAKLYNGGNSDLKRRIISIEKRGREEAQCIKVDHPNGLYITDDFIVTHNSDLLLGAALTQHRKSIIFRREYTQFKDLVPRSREIIGQQGRFNHQQMLWRNLPGGRTIEFGSVKTDDDAEKYKGRPHDLKAFDEVSDLSEDHYLFLNGWLRTNMAGQRTRIIAAGNPPTQPEGFWVIKRWRPWLDPQYANPAAPGELRWFVRINDEDVEVENEKPVMHSGEELTPKSRTFIPALLDDNPFYVQTGYRTTLQSMPEPLRSQLLYGDFTVGLADDAWQVVPTAWIIAAQNRWKKIVRDNGGIEPILPLDTIGVDVARGGRDKTVLAPRCGTFFRTLIKFKGIDTRDGPIVAALVIKEMQNTTVAVVDAIGVGTSVFDKLVEEGVPVVPFDARLSTDSRDRSTLQGFVNQRSEQAWKMREALSPEVPEEFQVALPPDAELTADLCALRWTPTPRGIQVLSKEEIAKLIHRSTDSGDAVLNALWLAVVTTGGDGSDDYTAAVGGESRDIDEFYTY